MGPFARKALQEARRFGQKSIVDGSRSFGRKITSVAQHRGNQIADVSGKLANHADLLGLDGVSKGLRAVGHGASEIANVGRLLDQNRPKDAVNKVMRLIGKDY